MGLSTIILIIGFLLVFSKSAQLNHTVFIHQNELFEYNLTDKCVRDNCIVTSVDSDPPLPGISVQNKTDVYFRDIPPEYTNFDIHSASNLYNFQTGTAYLVLLFNNQSYAIASINDYKSLGTIHFKLKSLDIGYSSYSCTKFQLIPGKNIYETFCLTQNPLNSETSFFFIRCNFGNPTNNTEPQCKKITETDISPIPCNLTINSKYYARISLQSPYDVYIVFNKSHENMPGSAWVVSQYNRIRELKDISTNFSTIQDVIFTGQDNGKGVAIALEEGILYGYVNSEYEVFSYLMRNSRGVTAFCSREIYETNKKHFYAFLPDTCVLRQLSALFRDDLHIRLTNIYGSGNYTGKYLKTETTGQSLIKLKNYVATFVKMHQTVDFYRNIVVFFDTKNTVDKYIYDTIELPKSYTEFSLLLLNPLLDISFVLSKKQIMFITTHPTSILFSVQKDQQLQEHSITAVMSEKYWSYSKTIKINVQILGEFDHSIKRNSKQEIRLFGWNEEDNIHSEIFKEFSGDNFTISCDEHNFLYKCQVTEKINLIQTNYTNWNLTPSSSVYLLHFDSDQSQINLWELSKTPKHFTPVHPFNEKLHSILNSYQEAPDITESIYFGNELFTSSEDMDTIYTYYSNGYGSTISTYTMISKKVDSRRFIYTTRDFKITGLHYNQYNNILYIVLRMDPQMLSYVEALGYSKPIKFPYTIDYLFFDTKCTVIFYGWTEVNIFFGWNLWAENPYKSMIVPQYIKVIGNNGDYFIFVDKNIEKDVSCIEHWIPSYDCEMFNRVKSYNLHQNEVFNLNGTIISKIYLHYLIFISYIENQGYILNILDFKESQRNFLYASIKIRGLRPAQVQTATIHCLRENGRDWLVLIGENFYQYYLIELNPYLVISSPDLKLHYLILKAHSYYNPYEITTRVEYNVTRCIKNPHRIKEIVYMNYTIEDCYLLLNHYINGFNLHYSVNIKSVYSNNPSIETEIKQYVLSEYVENPDDKIITIYRCSENAICAFRDPQYRNMAPIDQYVFEREFFRIEPILKVSAFSSTASISDIFTSQFKDISAFILMGKSLDYRLFEYMITLTEKKMYELAAVRTDNEASYLAIDSKFSQLILHNKYSKQLLAIGITEKSLGSSQIGISHNCSTKVFPTKVLFCPQIAQLFTATAICGLQIFDTSVFPYEFQQSFSLEDLLNTDNLQIEIQGIFGCDTQIYLVLGKQGIMKFQWNDDDEIWEYDSTIPNYNNDYLSEYIAFDNSVMAIFGRNINKQIGNSGIYSATASGSKSFIRILDLSRPSHAIPVFDFQVKSDLCNKLLLYSTGVQGIYHLFYLCEQILCHSSFTLTPSIKLMNIPENTFNISIRGRTLDNKHSVYSEIILKANAKVELNLLWPLCFLTPIILVIVIFLYCCLKQVDDRTDYTDLIKELKEYEQKKSNLSKESKSSASDNENVVIQ